jgi:putative ABC transport system substrate-binding protein
LTQTSQDRRSFIATLASGLLAAPLAAEAQQARKVPVVGFLHSGGTDSLTQLREALRDIGYIEGKNIVLERRSSRGNPEAFPALAEELVRLNVDVLYATGPPAVRAARDATSVIPIVALDLETDPVQSGLVRSLGRPGGNLTGLFLDLPSLAGKWLELLKEAVPGRRRRVGVLWDSTTGPLQLAAAKASAQRLDVEVQILKYSSANDLDEALRAGVSAGSKSIVMLSSPIASANSKRIADFMLRNRTPAISPFRRFASSGGLMSYGPKVIDFYRLGATYVDKILKGAKPADLPVEQPTKFELVINMKTAKALGLTIPPSLLLRADEMIQ